MRRSHSLLDAPVVVIPGAVAVIEAARRRRRRRRFRRMALVIAAGAVVAAVVVAAVLATPTGVAPPRMRTRTPAAAAADAKDFDGQFLDMFWSAPLGDGSSVNLTVDLGTGAVRRVRDAPDISAIPRQGYLFAYSDDASQSESYDLRHTMAESPSHDESYPAPATNPADLWLTNLTSDSGIEVGERLRPVAPPVALPPSEVIVGQVGGNLALIGPAPEQNLVLWNAQTQRVVSTLGSMSSVLVDPVEKGSLIAWSGGDAVDVANQHGTSVQSIPAPPGHEATSLAFSANGSQLAIVWSLLPGSSAAAAPSLVTLTSFSTGTSTTLSGVVGARGPVAWTADGRHVIVPVTERSGSLRLIGVARSGAVTKLAPTLAIPGYFSSTAGSIVAWEH